VEARSGTLVDFLDEFEVALEKHICSSIASGGMASSSRTWTTPRTSTSRRRASCTLFMTVVLWLVVSEWNKTAGALKPGNVLTVGGEFAGETRKVGSYWAPRLSLLAPLWTYCSPWRMRAESKRVCGALGCGTVSLRRSVTPASPTTRSTTPTPCASSSTKCEAEGEGGNNRSTSVITREGLTVLAAHSDNAAQHFKSSKSLHYFTTCLLAHGFTSIVWDFGAPGHGRRTARDLTSRQFF